jgi:hypothetical protein
VLSCGLRRYAGRSRIMFTTSTSGSAEDRKWDIFCPMLSGSWPKY